MRYADLGVRPVVNAAATFTRLGGSVMPAEVVAAMGEAAGSFVDLEELHLAAGRTLAKLTGNESGYVCSGAAAGIVLAVTACLGGADSAQVFPPGAGDVVMFRGQRNGYDYAVRQTGARIVEVAGDVAAFTAALEGQERGSARPGCVVWFEGPDYAADALAVEEVIELAKAAGVPVLVDAAAQIPPVSTLWRYTVELGADAVIVSGGKGLRGPQASGLVLGRAWIVESCLRNASPYAGIGRPMKVGKEELVGLLAAVQWSLAQDEPAVIAGYEESVRLWVEGLAGIPGLTVARAFPSEAGQPHPRAVLRFGPAAAWTPDQLVDALWRGSPRIAIGRLNDEPAALALNPQTLQPGEDRLVLTAVHTLLTEGAS